MRALLPLLLALAGPTSWRLPAQEPAPLPPPEERAVQAVALVEQGRAAEAVPILEQLLRDQEDSGAAPPLVLARTLNNLARALAEAGRTDEAVDRGQAALEQARTAGDPNPATAEIRRNLAEICFRARRVDEARRWIEAACKDLETVYGRTPMAADAHEAAARMALAAGDREAARGHLELTLAIREVLLGSASPETARALSAMAGFLAGEGRLALAVALHLRAAGALAAVGGRGGAPWRAERLAAVDLLLRCGLQGPAAESVQDLLPAGEELPLDAKLEVAGRLLQVGLANEARHLLQGLLDGLSGEDAQEDRIRVLVPLVRALEQSGATREALDVAREAAARVREALGEQNELYAGVLDVTGRLLLADGDLEGAMKVLREALDLRREALGEAHPALLGTFLTLAGAEEALHGATVGLVDLLDMARAAAAATPPPMLAARRNEAWWQTAAPGDEPLVRGHFRLASARPEKYLAPAVAALDRRLELDPVVAMPGWIASAQPQAAAWREAVAGPGVALDDLRRALERRREHLLLLAWTGAHVYGLVLGPAVEDDRIADLGPAATLAPLLAAAEAGLRDPGRTLDLGPLSERILAPIWPALVEVRRVVVVADGPLAFLPLEALPIPEGPGKGAPWVQQCRVTYAASLGSLTRPARAPAAGKGTLRLGPPHRLPDDTPSLRLRWIRDRFAEEPAGPQATLAEAPGPDDLFLAGAAARESALKEAARGGRLRAFRLLRFEAPLFLDTESPAATAMLLSPEEPSGAALWEREDGLLTLPEIATLDLDADAVLLPAVSTGPDPTSLHPRAEGLHALVRALGAAGARSILLAGWPAADPPAQAFARRLLDRCRQEGGELEDSLAEVQRAWLRRADAPSHPAVWARWRLFRP